MTRDKSVAIKLSVTGGRPWRVERKAGGTDVFVGAERCSMSPECHLNAAADGLACLIDG